MSDRHLRRKIPVSRRRDRSRVPKPSISPSGHRRRITPVPPPRRSSKQHRSITTSKDLERSKSEPCLLKFGIFDDFDDDDRRKMSPEIEILFRPQTCTDVFLSSDYQNPGSPQSFERYNKDAKVVVNVTVEGSPGPVRAMVKLGSSVDETVRLVVNKYSEEGRMPRLDKDAGSSFQLYQSHFSLQSLKKTDVIGDVGSRSFHLRKSNINGSNQEIAMEIAPVKANSPPVIVVHGFIARKMSEIIRSTCKLWKILGCI